MIPPFLEGTGPVCARNDRIAKIDSKYMFAFLGKKETFLSSDAVQKQGGRNKAREEAGFFPFTM